MLISNHAFAEEIDTALVIGETCQATEITKDGITFYFSEERTIGKFANGDFWVLAPVTITKITPDYDGYNNGWEVNPIVEGGHGFQDGGEGGGFDPNLVPQLPYTTSETLSIVKTTASGIRRPCIKKAVVLTVVEDIPLDNGQAVFRPPYVGTEKPFYKVADLRTDLLPSYEPVENMPTFEAIKERFSSLQMDHKKGMFGRSVRPQDNMMDYQPKNTADQNNAVLRFMMNDPIEDKMPALINFVQFGIDKIHTMYLGQTWPNGGGHQPGHRIVLAFAATMLDIQKAKEDLRAATFFHGMEYFAVGKNTEGLVLWGDLKADRIEQRYWEVIDKSNANANKSRPDPYGYIDGGIVVSYQIITSQAHKGEMLATYLMPKLKEAWNMDEWEIVSSYVDRWVYHGKWMQPDPIAPCDDNNSNYGITYGPDKDTGIPITGTGRFISSDGAYRDGGQYRSNYVASMWDTYRHTADGAETTPPFAMVSFPSDDSISMKNISTTVELKAKAYGIHGIDSVQFRVDGQNLGAPVTMATDSSTNMYRYFWDISDIPSGTYNISAIATDKKGNTYTAMAHKLTILEQAEADTLKLIANPVPIVSIANGTEKTAEALMLPRQITMLTYEGATKGDVAWDVNSCAYVPSNTDEQTFTVAGDVSLPSGVLNQNDIPLKVEITVTVNASTEADKVFESVVAPENITGIANGTAKTAEALGLPEKEVIITNGGKTLSDVIWQVEKCPYDPANVCSQTFVINGVVSLPPDVVNPINRAIKASVYVTVYAADPTDRALTSITAPKPVASVPNGAAKTEAALKLPTTVTMVTDRGSVQASVNWDVDSCTYDANDKEGQTFVVEGAVAMPSGVANPDNVPLTVSISVTVNKAADKPEDPDKPDKPDNPDKPTTPAIPTTPPDDGNQDEEKDPVVEDEDLITKDYPEMVEQLELLYESADIRDNKLNPTYGGMMKRDPVTTLTPKCQNRLKQLAKLSFSDIKGNEWYASHIPLAVYRKLINGFPDGTLRGNNQVTRAEFLTMLARFNSSEGGIKRKAEQEAESRARIVKLMGDSWYTNYVLVAQGGLIYPDQYTSETIQKPMTRGEVFYALAQYLWREDISEGGKYYKMTVEKKNPAFSDTSKTVNIANTDANGATVKSYSWYKQLVSAAEKPEAGVPMDFYPAIMCLKDKGILLGNNGESKWYDPISRAEALALFERLARVWGQE